VQTTKRTIESGVKGQDSVRKAIKLLEQNSPFKNVPRSLSKSPPSDLSLDDPLHTIDSDDKNIEDPLKTVKLESILKGNT
jgi:hypothetical protein